MEAAPRDGGAETGLAWVQVVPSQAQVSPRANPAAAKPPKSTALRVAGSKVSEAPYRAGGLAAVVTWVQVVPSQDHNALLGTPLVPWPPKSRILWATSS